MALHNNRANEQESAHCIDDRPRDASESDSIFKVGKRPRESLKRMDPTTQPLLVYELDQSSNNLQRNDRVRKLSTFFGVLVPCVLCMFSAILYLRLGFAVGQAGLYRTIGMYVLGYVIVTLTTLSLSAISTNGAIEGGGAYFMISRALGPEFGGSIGVMFFVANIFSSALYCIGFTEALMDNFGENGSFVMNSTFYLERGYWPELGYSSALLMFCFVVCIIGAQMFAKTQLLIFLTVLASIISAFISFFIVPEKEIPIHIDNEHFHLDIIATYTGLNVTTFNSNLGSNYTKDFTTGKLQNFVQVFAVIFNGCVGIMAGANISGELKNPSKAIPRGTLGALLFTAMIYVVLIFMIAATCSRDLLLYDYNYLQHISAWAPAIAIGIFASTLSAALSALIGSSRILLALAKDNLFGPVLWPIQKLITSSGNPIGAVLLSWLFTQGILLIGELNTIAALVSIFFLLSYACVNLACLALDLASAPNFRPSFTYFTWYTSLAGFLGCIVMMFFINIMWSSLSILVFFILLLVIYFCIEGSEWGYISQALIFHQVRKYLLLLDTRKNHVKFWRPQILLLVSNPRASCHLIRFVNDMKKSGLFVLGHVKKGVLDDFPSDPIEWEQPAWLRLVEMMKVKAFVELTLAPTVREGAQHLMRISGLGGMKPNMVVLGFYDSVIPEDNLKMVQLPRRAFYGTVNEDADDGASFVPLQALRVEGEEKLLSVEEYVAMIYDIIRLQKGVCIARNFHSFNRDELSQNGPKHIDIWPVNFLKPETAGYLDAACIFLLQVACVVHMVPYWRKHCSLRVFLCVNSDYASTNHKKEKLKKFLDQLRIIAEIVILPWNHITTINTKEECDFDGLASNLVRSVSEEYLHALNSMMRDQSDSTAVLFCYLPLPPADKSLHCQYLHQMDILTRDLPPTMMVHGLREVTSTAL